MFRLNQIKVHSILNIPYLEFVANLVTFIVGESGSGKTTLLRLLNKLRSPDEGEIFYKEHNLRDLSSVKLRREVVMLPQYPIIFSGSIKENLLIGLRFSEKPPVTDDVLTEILSKVQLNKNLNDDSDKLSGGEKQRLALARIILMDPETYLLDEPSSALDEETEKNIIEQLVDHVKRKKKTLIMVTHSKRVAQRYADVIVELQDGSLLPKGIYSNQNKSVDNEADNNNNADNNDNIVLEKVKL